MSYPWDRPSSGGSGKHPTADQVTSHKDIRSITHHLQELFHHLAEGYVTSHPEMKNSTCFRRCATFTLTVTATQDSSVAGGLINGAAWNSANRRQGEKSGSMRVRNPVFNY